MNHTRLLFAEAFGQNVVELSNLEKLALRLQALPRGKLVSIQTLIGEDGQPLFWVVAEVGKPEGLHLIQAPANGAD